MSQRLHARRPAPHLARPIDRKGSNPGRALGGLLLVAGGAGIAAAVYLAIHVMWVILG